MMPDAQDLKPIPPTPIILDGISNLVGAYVNGLSKRTQYYSFIDTAKGNSLQQPYQLWFARAILEPLEKAEKKAMAKMRIRQILKRFALLNAFKTVRNCDDDLKSN